MATTISKPVVISQYTKFMGGVDRADHYCGSYAFLRVVAKDAGSSNCEQLYLVQSKQKTTRIEGSEICLILQLVGNVRNKNANKFVVELLMWKDATVLRENILLTKFQMEKPKIVLFAVIEK